MKLKYYFRGAGVGIIVTTLILTIAFAFSKDHYISDEEVIKRATALGYVLLESQTENSDGTNVNEINEAIEEGKEFTSEPSSLSKSDSINNVDKSTNKIEVKSDDSADEDDNLGEKSKTSTNSSGDKVVEYVPFTVSPGESSNTVAEHLVTAGIIDDSTEFNLYMNKVGIDSLIQAGTFYVSTEYTYDDLCAILATKQQDRDLSLPENAKVFE